MSVTRPTELRRWLAEYGIQPNPRWGQNFLADGNVARCIVDAAELAPGETVVEIGPGLGALTELLLEHGHPVVAIERDARLCQLLRDRLGARPGFTLLGEDALDVDWTQWVPHGADTLVSNLPYSSGTRILVRLFELARPPRRMIVTVQKEVAERIVAPAGDRERGIVSILAQRIYDVQLLRYISPTCFWPRPEVRSALLRFELRRQPRGEPVSTVDLCEFLKAVFGGRRKQLWRALERAGWLPEAARRAGPAWLGELGISPTDRPEQLEVEAWTRLYTAVASQKPASGGRTCD
jgi:16S rRNA (adenine1518-N6/adenine1519-N6)-dimethyltransferase